MNGMQNPPASPPTEESTTAGPSSSDDGDNSSETQTTQDDSNTSETRSENNQTPDQSEGPLYLKLSQKSREEIMSVIRRNRMCSQSEGPLNLDLSIAVGGHTYAGSCTFNPIQNPGTLTPPIEATTMTVSASGDRISWSARPVGNFNSRFGSTSRGVNNTSPPPSSVQRAGHHHHHHGMLPEPEVQTLSQFPIQESYSGVHVSGQAYGNRPLVSPGTTPVRLPLPAQAINVGPLFHPGHSYPRGLVPVDRFNPVNCYPREMQPEVPTHRGLQYPTGYHHRQGMQGQAPNFRPSVPSDEVVPARRTASIAELIGRGTENPSTANMGQPLRESRQAVAVRGSASNPGPISIPSANEKIRQESGNYIRGRRARISELTGRGTENPLTANMGQPLRASRQTVAAPDPGPMSIPSPIMMMNRPVEPSRPTCPVCKRIAYVSGHGQGNEPAFQQNIAIFPCGHTFHLECLDGPAVCPVCGPGDET